MIAQQRAASKVMYVLYHGEYKGQESVRVGGSLTPFFAPLDCCAAATFCGYCPGLVAACCAAATTRDYQLQLPRWDVPYPRSPTPAAKGGLLAALRYQVETVLCVGVMAACIMRLVPLLRVLEKFWRRLQRRYPANGVMAMKHVSLMDGYIHHVLGVQCRKLLSRMRWELYRPTSNPCALFLLVPWYVVSLHPSTTSIPTQSWLVAAFRAQTPLYCATHAHHYRPTREDAPKHW
jgi:hypothetical protein